MHDGMPITLFSWKLCFFAREHDFLKNSHKNGEKFCFCDLQIIIISAGIARCFCLPLRSTFQRICVRVLPCRRTTLSLVHFLFQNLATFRFLLRKFVTRTFSCAPQRDSRSFCLFLIFRNWLHIQLLSCQFDVVHVYGYKKSLLVMDRHSKVGAFSHPICSTIFLNYFTYNRPARGCPHNFLSKNTTGSSMLCHPVCHLYRGRRVQISGHSDPRNFVSVGVSSFLTWA